MDWYKIKQEETIDTPSLLIYSDRVEDNVKHLLHMVDDVNRLRPHMKTNKSREAAEILIKASITKFKCATIAEAETLAISGAKDVLLAYQPIGPKQIRLISLIKSYPRTAFSCLIDNMETAERLSQIATGSNLSVGTYVDINLGMGRTGILPGEPAAALFGQVKDLPGLHLLGLHVYDGHFRHPDFEERKKLCDGAFAKIEETQALIRDLGHHSVVIAGGSPTFPIHAKRDGVECSPGTFIYWDKGYSEICPEQPFQPAALVMTRIISIPSEDHLCLDLGHKSIAPENPIDRRVHFLNASVSKFLSQSEEHLVVEVEKGHSWKVGDVWYGVPIHICPTVALYDRALEIRHQEVVSSWKTMARDRSITI